MVVKDTPQIDPIYLSRASKEIKSPNRTIISKYTRECHELQEASNCKITTSKDLSKKEQEYYDEVFKRDNQINAAFVKPKAKKNKKEEQQ